MKKVILLLLILSIYISIGALTEEKVIIPNKAIRIRILANSNSDEDQIIKMHVKDNIEPYLFSILKDAKNYDEASVIINDHLDTLGNIIKNENVNQKYTINFGKNYFPEKEYKGIKYNEGYYNSLLITLGDGLGDNWWCILFPPLCMLDTMNTDDYEYRSLAMELINNVK